MLAIYYQIQLSLHQLCWQSTSSSIIPSSIKLQFLNTIYKNRTLTIKSGFENNVIVDTKKYLAN